MDICKREGYLYLLFEHKSYRDTGTALQLLRYMLAIWEAKQVKEHAMKLPVILPLLICHDNREWRVPTSLGELLEGYQELPVALQKYIPNFEYLLYDVSQYKDEDIRGSVRNRILLTLLRDARQKQGSALLASILHAFYYLGELEDKQSAVGYIETMLRYIAEVGDQLKKEDMEKIIERLENYELKGSDITMTLAEIWKNEGWEEGLQQGVQQGLQQGLQQGVQQGEIKALSRTVLILLTQKFGELPEELEQAINQANTKALNSITANIFAINSLAEVKAYLQ